MYGTSAPVAEPVNESATAIAAVDLVKVYGAGDTGVRALDGVTVGFTRGKFTAIMGPSGSGKSTLMHCLAGLDTASAGRVMLGDTDLTRLSDRALSELSGGQQQRVALARALLARPEVVYADEPTGNLDSRAGAEVLGFLRDSARQLGQTIVMVTHDPVAATYADRVVLLADGRIGGDIAAPTLATVTQALHELAGVS
jgi:putative ABC transport system ATP-binding protein